MKNHHSFKVFIVEDDVWYGSMLQHYLSLNPEYEVKRFEYPRDFFAQLHENTDVVTLDYSLPDCDGAEVLKKIKERKHPSAENVREESPQLFEEPAPSSSIQVPTQTSAVQARATNSTEQAMVSAATAQEPAARSQLSD